MKKFEQFINEEINLLESHKVGDKITFQHEFAGDSKMKHKAEIVSVNGKKLKVKVLSGDMKDKETDIESSMICEEESINEAMDLRYLEILIKNLKEDADDIVAFFKNDKIETCEDRCDSIIKRVKEIKSKF